MTPLVLSVRGLGDHARGERMRGGGRGHTGGEQIVCGYAHGVIMVRDLLCQPEAQCRVPVWILVLQVTGESNYLDHLLL